MKQHRNLIFYVYFYFIILLISSCSTKLYSQNNIITTFFIKEKTNALNNCLNYLEKDEDYLYAKSENNTEIMKLLKSNCSSIAENFDLFKNNSLRLFNSRTINSDDDFIIINLTLKSTERPNPVLTIMKFKNENKYEAIHNSHIDDDKREFHQNDQLTIGYKTEENYKILENYFYKNIQSDRIFKSFKEAEQNYKDFKTYYIITRISGKIETKKMYFADSN